MRGGCSLEACAGVPQLGRGTWICGACTTQPCACLADGEGLGQLDWADTLCCQGVAGSVSSSYNRYDNLHLVPRTEGWAVVSALICSRAVL